MEPARVISPVIIIISTTMYMNIILWCLLMSCVIFAHRKTSGGYSPTKIISNSGGSGLSGGRVQNSEYNVLVCQKIAGRPVQPLEQTVSCAAACGCYAWGLRSTISRLHPLRDRH